MPQRVFVIRPFGPKKDSSGKVVDFEQVHALLIGPALEAAGLAGSTTGEIIDAGNIREDMFALIIEADLVVCDITVHNANVFYELGIRHALRKKRSILVKGAPVADATPFDILTDRYLPYEVEAPGKAKDALVEVIKATLASPRETDSPVFKMLPALAEVDPDTVHVVPTDFTEEVRRATVAKAPGWLRLLASEVAGRRFQWPAFRMIGQALWNLADVDGARRLWEQVRENAPDDVEANLALANCYERQYRRDGRAELLEASNQAIARVLSGDRIAAGKRAEALALQGRNQKTLWRRDFEALTDVAARRERATNRSLRKAYESYREAYLVDLNHYWSGLAALQMGSVALDLSREDSWQDAFDDTAEAARYRDGLTTALEALRPSVALSIEAALKRATAADRVWAAISDADHAFLTETRGRRVINAYLDAVPPDNFFAWSAARQQLELFASLGIGAELAMQVIQQVDARVASPPPTPDLHVVVFAGHRIDERDRHEPRFPAEREARARDLIVEALKGVRVDGSRLRVLASAAPGSDILCHEVCVELGIEGTVCLPMPRDDFARLAFGDLDAWRSRFLGLVRDRAPLQLSDREGLPQWLRETKGLDPWERGNRWVLEMAQTSGAPRVTLIALWDGKDTLQPPGGTAHIVRIARATGTVDVKIIDAARLLTA